MDEKIPSETRNPESDTADRCNADRFDTEGENVKGWTSFATHPLGRFGWRLMRVDNKPNPATPD